MRGAFQQFSNKPGMQCMPGPICRESPQNRLPDQSKVAKEVQCLVTDEFVWKTQRCVIEHAGLGKHDCVLERPATDESARLKLLYFVIETERSSRRNKVRIIRSCELDLQALLSDQRMYKVDVVLDRKSVRGIDAQGFSALFQDEFLRDANILPWLFPCQHAAC